MRWAFTCLVAYGMLIPQLGVKPEFDAMHQMQCKSALESRFLIIGKQILNHWTTKKIPNSALLIKAKRHTIEGKIKACSVNTFKTEGIYCFSRT